MSFKKQMSTTFRRSLLIGIPVATVVGLTALAYAVPNIFSSGQGLSSSLMNANFASLESEIAALEAEIGGPGVTPNLANQVANVQYQVNSLTIPAATVTVGSVDATPAEDFYGNVTLAANTAGGAASTPATIFAAVNCFMTVTTACFVTGGAVGTNTLIEAQWSTDDFTWQTYGWDTPVPYASGNDSGASTSIYFNAQAGSTYYFATELINPATYIANSIFRCNLQAVCSPN
jgi:hypothetical protein